MSANYTPAQAENAFTDLWERLSKDVNSEDRPHGYILGGQPGAGKTLAMQRITGHVPHLIINGDEFRKHHPAHEQLKGIESTYPATTQSFANEMAQRCLQRAIAKRLSLVIEGTMRNPEVPARTAQRLRDNGYRVHAHVVTTQPELSWQSCQARYQLQKETRGFGRQVDRAIHDQACTALADTVTYLVASQAMDMLTVHDRQGPVFTATSSHDAALAVAWVIDGQHQPLQQMPKLDIERWFAANGVCVSRDQFDRFYYDADKQTLHTPPLDPARADAYWHSAVHRYAYWRAAQELDLSEFEQRLYTQSMLAVVGARSGLFKPDAARGASEPVAINRPITVCQRTVAVTTAMLNRLSKDQTQVSSTRSKAAYPAPGD